MPKTRKYIKYRKNRTRRYRGGKGSKKKSKSKKIKKNGVVFTFGRFNPFHSGHLGLLNTILDTTFKLYGNFDKKVFISNPKPLKPSKKEKKLSMSRSYFKKSKWNRNPFNAYQKTYWTKQMIPKNYDVDVINTALYNIKNYENAVQYLIDEGYRKIYMVLGSDRFNQVKGKRSLIKYNEMEIDGVKMEFKFIENPRIEEEDQKSILYSMPLTPEEKKSITKLSSAKTMSASSLRAAASNHVWGRKKGISWRFLRTGIPKKKKKNSKNFGLTDPQLESMVFHLKKEMHLNPTTAYIDTYNKIYPAKNVRNTTRKKTLKSLRNKTLKSKLKKNKSKSKTKTKSKSKTISEKEENEKLITDFEKLKLTTIKEEE